MNIKTKKALVFVLAFVMVFAACITSGIGSKEDWRAYAADNANAQYSLANAEYWVYTNSGCTTRAEAANGDPAVLKTNANGETAEIELEAGTYYVKEKKASKGYILDTTVYTVRVDSGEVTWVNGGIVREIPQSAPLKIQKIDKETGKAVPMGGATLKDAKFQIVYTDGAQVSEDIWIHASPSERSLNPMKWL